MLKSPVLKIMICMEKQFKKVYKFVRILKIPLL